MPELSFLCHVDKEKERERLFEGGSTESKPKLRTAEEVRAKYRKTGVIIFKSTNKCFWIWKTNWWIYIWLLGCVCCCCTSKRQTHRATREARGKTAACKLFRWIILFVPKCCSLDIGYLRVCMGSNMRIFAMITMHNSNCNRKKNKRYIIVLVLIDGFLL